MPTAYGGRGAVAGVCIRGRAGRTYSCGAPHAGEQCSRMPPRIRKRAAHVTGRPPRTTTDRERHRASGRRHGSEDTRGRTGHHYRPGTVCAEFSPISPSVFSKNTGGSGQRIPYKLDVQNCCAHASALWAPGTSCAEFGSKSPSVIFSYIHDNPALPARQCSQKVPCAASIPPYTATGGHVSAASRR